VRWWDTDSSDDDASFWYPGLGLEEFFFIELECPPPEGDPPDGGGVADAAAASFWLSLKGSICWMPTPLEPSTMGLAMLPMEPLRDEMLDRFGDCGKLNI
jgi:hypothetical protein